MNVLQYKQIIEETAIYPQEVNNFGVAYCWLGLQGEYGEAFKASTVEEVYKEVGDVIWYITALSKELELDINFILDGKNLDNIVTTLDNKFFPFYSERIKKFYRDDKDFTEEEKSVLQVRLAQLLSYLFYKLNLNSEDLALILVRNYDKLIKRRQTNTLHGDGDNREET